MPDDLERLSERMRVCRLCSDLPLGPRPIFQLSAQARVLIAGQAPGRITHAKRRPFDDPSGDRLRNWLGVDRGTFYSDPRIAIFPMGLCFPGSGSGGDIAPPPICARTWRRPVLDQLAGIELTLVLGAYAIAWHCPDLRRMSVRDAVSRTARGDGHVLVLPHPSPRNNRWLRSNSWFEAEVVPRIQARIQTLLDPNGG